MTDAIQLLHDIIKVQADGSPMTPHLQAAIDEIERHRTAVDDKAKDIATLQQALAEKDDELEKLKSAAGAVSSGKSFAEIKAEAKTQPVDPAANEPNS